MRRVGKKLIIWGAFLACLAPLLAIAALLLLESEGHGEPGVGLGLLVVTVPAIGFGLGIVAIGTCMVVLNHPQPSNSRRAYKLNVVGEFYVEDGCCTLCGVPGVTAPKLFGGFKPDGTLIDGIDHCWVQCQPISPAELEAMVETMARQEQGCIRYRGTNPQIVARLREIGEEAQVDAL